MIESLKSKGKEIKREIHAVVPHLNCGRVAESVRCSKPTEFIQNSSQRKTAEGLSPQSRASVPGCPFASGDSKAAGFSVEMIVYNVQQTAQKLSGAVHFSSSSPREPISGRPRKARSFQLLATTLLPESPNPGSSSTSSITPNPCYFAQIQAPGSAEFGQPGIS